MNGRIIHNGSIERDAYMIFIQSIVTSNDECDAFVLLYVYKDDVYDDLVVTECCNFKQTRITMFDNEHNAFVHLSSLLRLQLNKFANSIDKQYPFIKSAITRFNAMYESVIAFEQYKTPAKLYVIDNYVETDLLDEDFEYIKHLL